MWVLHRRYGQGDDVPWLPVDSDADQAEVDEVMKMLHEAAEHGTAKAQYNLGVLYDGGQGVPKDEALAITLYQKAANQGYASAQCKSVGWSVGRSWRWYFAD